MNNNTIKLVEEFHKAFDHPIANEKCLPNQERMMFRIDFLNEELDEIEKAFNDNNTTDLIDGICDFQYVLDGLVIESGLQEFIKRDIELHYYSPLVQPGSTICFSVNTMDYISRIRKGLSDLISIYNAKEVSEFSFCILWIQNKLYDFAFSCNMEEKYQKLMEEVHRSNMSKACLNENEVEDTMKKLSKENIETHYKKIGDYFVVYRSSDNKVMKSINYSKVDFSKILLG